MLVLMRRVGETITIGDSITITILDVKGRQARVGVSAPAELPVHRLEVAERIKAGIPHPRGRENR